MNNSITVTEKEGILVVDSRLVANALGINHADWLGNVVYKHQTIAEKHFGVFRFENDKPQRGSKGGRPERYALLTEDQATFLMTLSKNTPEVVQCKASLVRAFSEAKKRLQKPAIANSCDCSHTTTTTQINFKQSNILLQQINQYLTRRRLALVELLGDVESEKFNSEIPAGELTAFLREKERNGELDRRVTTNNIGAALIDAYMDLLGYTQTINECGLTVWVAKHSLFADRTN